MNGKFARVVDVRRTYKGTSFVHISWPSGLIDIEIMENGKWAIFKNVSPEEFAFIMREF